MSEVVLSRHENKNNPAPIPNTKIVEAFGLRKCPKLVEQITDESLEVRINALTVLCEEFNNPYSIHGCVHAGAVKILAEMVTDPDFATRDKASLALAIAAKDALGLTAILEDEVVGDILQGINDPVTVVRSQVYECLLHITRTTEGILASVDAGVTAALVQIVTDEAETLQPTILQTIYNICKCAQGLDDVLRSGGVPVCIQILSSPQDKSEEVIESAARTLGFIAYADEAKEEAINNNSVAVLVNLLKFSKSTSIRSAVTMALMAVSSTDEGKRQMVPTGLVSYIMELLRDRDRIVRANTLKIVSNVAVAPEARSILSRDPDVMALLKEMADSSDTFLSKHAKVALSAVMWKP